MSNYHVPVLLQEVKQWLNVKKDKLYIDATLGGGGHTSEIIVLGGKVLGIDVDQDAIDYVWEKFKVQSSKFKVKENLILVRGNFVDIDTIAHLHGFNNVSGILFDLGVSSFQLNTAERGFSFQKEGPLDMRMSKSLSVKASDLVNGLTKGELSDIFFRLGEERNARAIVEGIIRERAIKPIETTLELAQIIHKAVPKRFSNINEATKVFQALRIVVNDELDILQQALPKALSLLEKDGRLLVVSFHSLEDRIVKHMFKKFEEQGLGSILTKKPVMATEKEVNQNIRSRSAKLRVYKKQ